MKEKIIPAFPQNNIPLCFYSNAFYIPYLAAALLSAIQNASAKTNLDILIFNDDYSEKNKKDLKSYEKDNVSIRFIDMEIFNEELPIKTTKRYPHSCYAKVFCLDEIFSNYSKLIIVDSDLLILEDLSDLYNIDLQDKSVAAVESECIKVMIKNSYHTDKRFCNVLLKDYLENMGVNYNDYFNSGVLLYNVTKCLKNFAKEKLIKFNETYPELMYPAQDDLNVVFKDDWLKIDLKWNYENPYCLASHIKDFPCDYLNFLEHSSILHFLGKSKPWDDGKVFNGSLFDKYALSSKWGDEYVQRKKKNISKKRFELLLFPKGSLRREIYFKIKFFILQTIGLFSMKKRMTGGGTKYIIHLPAKRSAAVWRGRWAYAA